MQDINEFQNKKLLSDGCEFADDNDDAKMLGFVNLEIPAGKKKETAATAQVGFWLLGTPGRTAMTSFTVFCTAAGIASLLSDNVRVAEARIFNSNTTGISPAVLNESSAAAVAFGGTIFSLAGASIRSLGENFGFFKRELEDQEISQRELNPEVITAP